MSLDNVGRLSTNNGNIISLVSNDSLIALEFTRFFNQAWTAPFVLVAGIIYIEVLVGVSVWAGLSVLVLFVPYSIWQGKIQAKVQSTKMQKTDSRVKVTNEALLGIKVVKVNAWEDALVEVRIEQKETADLPFCPPLARWAFPYVDSRQSSASRDPRFTETELSSSLAHAIGHFDPEHCLCNYLSDLRCLGQRNKARHCIFRCFSVCDYSATVYNLSHGHHPGLVMLLKALSAHKGSRGKKKSD